MKKTMLCLIGSLALATGGMAQRISPSVLAAGGGSARTATMSLDWTVGEAVVETATTSTRLYTQGFHQPLLQVSEPPTLKVEAAGYSFTIAPNPVATNLTLGIAAPESSPLKLLLTDMNGRQYSLPIVPANTTSTQIDMTTFPAGIYLLRIGKTDGPQLKAYKILKTQ
ncbi:T9SS type A sorting domain-containing protein [Fibrella sp. HMF5335]|uniref:T9SS type A sorting domain-containing protein n=1 Tax=Fibrella rubiginis TaxID=2817060 RepID=A0A939GGJ5_9BACT|nr:T9SS type A sorting domain-containing protein [Fibrella rubiginis]MBO0936048.1 T9SS type A sorting domain-containing protein [Fibrella rubiginis]